MPVCSLRSRGVLAVLAMLGASGAIVAMLSEVRGRSHLRVAPGGSARSLDLRSAHRPATRAGDGQTRASGGGSGLRVAGPSCEGSQDPTCNSVVLRWFWTAGLPCFTLGMDTTQLESKITGLLHQRHINAEVRCNTPTKGYVTARSNGHKFMEAMPVDEAAATDFAERAAWYLSSAGG